MFLSSPAFRDKDLIPKKYTCDGREINPPLEIKDVPEGAKSLVLIVDDPDAPHGVFVHWLVWNINPGLNKIEEDSIPDKGIEGLNSAGGVGYQGPCPPFGTHRYFFKLYALDIELGLASDTSAEELEQTISGHVLASAELIGLYGH